MALRAEEFEPMTKSASTIHPAALVALVTALVGFLLFLFVGGPGARTALPGDKTVASSDASHSGEAGTESEFRDADRVVGAPLVTLGARRSSLGNSHQ